MDLDTVSALGVGGKNHKQYSKRALNIYLFAGKLDVLNRDRVRKFGIPILKDIRGYTITKTNQSSKSNLSVYNLQN